MFPSITIKQNKHITIRTVGATTEDFLEKPININEVGNTKININFHFNLSFVYFRGDYFYFVFHING